jgi:exopolysaccharide production protein ExoY
MSQERRLRREAEPVQGGRARAVQRHFSVIEHGDAPLADASGKTGRVVQTQAVRETLKRILDLVGVAVLGLVFSPLMLAIAVLLHREGGPIIFRHRRVGRDGKAFDCLKFRSMLPDADRVLRDLLERQPELKAEWLRDHKLRNDPRITGVGRFLRRTSLDELPQLWNVVRGEMSLVGPRPVVREELLRYGRCAGIYLSARPGVTGLWQVKGRTNTDYRQRVVLDVYYVRRHNLFLDLYILAKTTRVVLGGSGAY